MDDSPGSHALTASATDLIPDGFDATLVLVRHGESTFIAEGRFQGQAQTPLSPTGVSQARLTGRRLADPHAAPALPVAAGPLVELVHSPLARTAQTAAAIAHALGAGGHSGGGEGPTVRPDPGLTEIGQGAWEGLLMSEIVARFGTELEAWRRRPLESWAPGGESIPEVADRVRPALARAIARLADPRAPGSGGSPDRSQVAGYDGDVADEPWSIVVAHDGIFKVAMLSLFDLPLDRFWMWSMDLCGISVVEFRAGRPILRAHNLTAHLAGLADEAAVTELEERSRSGAL